MKYKVTFPASEGQFAGTHSFHTKKAMKQFIATAIRCGAKEWKIHSP